MLRRMLASVVVIAFMAMTSPLQADIGAARKQLAEALGQFDDRVAATDMLIARLNDPDPDMRRAAGMIIVENTYVPQQRVDALANLAEKHPDADVRQSLVWALGTRSVDTTPAIPAMIRIMQADPHAPVRAYAADALGRLAKQPEVVVPALITALDDPAEGVRQCAAYALGMYDSAAAAALPRLMTMRNDSSMEVGNGARYAYYRIVLPPDAARAVPILITALDDPLYQIRHWAAERVGRFGADAAPAAPTLIKLMEAVEKETFPLEDGPRFNDVEQVGGLAAEALGRIGDEPGVVDALHEALRSQSWLVREKAAYAVHRIGKPAAKTAPRLAELLDDESASVQYAGEMALETLGADARGALLVLVDLLHRPKHDRMHTVVLVVGNIGELGEHAGEAIGLLGRIAQSWNEIVTRRAAADALKRIAAHHPRLCVPVLMELLKPQAWDMKGTVIEGLGNAGPAAAEAVPQLLTWLNDDAYIQTHRQIAVAIGRIHADPENTVPALMAQLETKKGSHRAMIAFALGMYGPDAKAALPRLRALATTGEFAIERRFAAEAVRRIDPHAEYLAHD